MPAEPGVFSANPDPRFWGEAGQVGKEKIETLVRRYPGTHFAIAKWDTALAPVEALVREALADVRREAPFDLMAFPPDSKARFIDEAGRIRLDFDSIEFLRL
jgi:hypothetical protein